jgi:selenocysteine lyase/cysteine desulfurase
MNFAAHPEFPLAGNIVYLNHAGVAPWPKRTADAVKAFAEENACAGAVNYLNWVRKEAFLREQLKELINAPSTDDIALVKNTSEALSMVAYGLSWKKGDNIVSSNEEFPSNRIPWESLASNGVEFRQAVLGSTIHPEERLFKLVDEKTRLITISSIQFASGIRLDVENIGRFCSRNGILFCIDAIQSLGAFRFDAQANMADFVMADGHKWMLGPEGLGLFYTSPQARQLLSLTQYGWHMIENDHSYENVPWNIAPDARRFECGSPNMLGIHALSASLSLLLETGMETVEQFIRSRTSYLTKRIIEQPLLTLLSPLREEQRSGIVVFRHNSIDNDVLFRHLRDHGIVCAVRGGGIRFSPHFYNTEAQLDQALAVVARMK